MTFDQSSITNTNTAAYAGSSGTYTGTSSGTYTGTSTTTGSWADSTHSVIWMTRGNVLRGMGLSHIKFLNGIDSQRQASQNQKNFRITKKYF